ncbi:MAG: hypothetical protein ACREH8_13185, partial [Opitutaceae bacterium]
MIPRSHLGRLALVALACAVFVSAGRAAEAARKNFDLPAAAAEVAFKRLATQAGVGVLFTTEMTAGVRTRAVRGELTTLEAANRMLAGTNLIAAEDARTGAITINRSPQGTAKKNGASRPQPANAGADRPAPPARHYASPTPEPDPNSPSEKSSNTMKPKRKNPLAIIGSWLALALAPGHTLPAADRSPASASSQNSAASEEPIALDPFEVRATTKGYMATNTISGTAMDTPLKNVPMTINVITSQFLEDRLIGDILTEGALDFNS